MSSHLEQVHSSVQLTRPAEFTAIRGINATECTQSARAHLDEDVAPATTSSSILRSCDYVSRLPCELLCAIFIASTLQWHMEWLSVTRPRSVLPPSVVVSHVCGFWRRVALNCSSLWSYLSLRSVRTMETFLARSKDSHLHIFFDDDFRRDSCKALLNALEHMDRIEELNLTCRWTETDTIAIWKKLRAHAPVLYSLRLEVIEFQTPTELFKGVVPRLGQVYLVDYPGNLSPVLSRQLTHLTMVGCDRMDLDHFFLVLKQMPKLQQLSWQSYEGRKLTRSTDRVELLCLQELTLHGHHSTVIMFLDRLKFPSNTVVKLHFPWLEEETADHLHTFIRDRFNSNLGMPQDYMTLRTLSIGGYRGNASIYYSSSVEANQMDPHPLDNYRHLYVTFDLIDDLFRLGCDLTLPYFKLCASLPVSHLCKLTIHSDLRHGPCSWPISNPPQLHTIIIDDGYPLNIIRTLVPYDVTTPIFAPALTEIWLRCVEFPRVCFCCDDQPGPPACGGERRPWIEPRPFSVMCFYHMLAKRAVRRFKLRRLRLEKCPGIGEDDVTKLREVVDEVEWIPEI